MCNDSSSDPGSKAVRTAEGMPDGVCPWRAICVAGRVRRSYLVAVSVAEPADYEGLDAGMAGVTLATLDFLGLDVPDERVIMPRHGRQADELTAQWIERYRLESARS